LKLIPGLEEAVVARPAYAIEYDYFPSYQIDLTMETKKISGLYFAGQVNGTSGYEEAASQGLIAGINAALKIQKRKEFTLKRSEAYIGVLTDDLVDKTINEPYRIFTSSAEHRLILRQDNADRRLLKYGYKFGLIPAEMYNELKEREVLISAGIEFFNTKRIKPAEINPFLQGVNTSEISEPELISKIIKRPEIRLANLIQDLKFDNPIINAIKKDSKALEQVEIELKYDGYISRELDLIAKIDRLENTKIPLDFNFINLNQLSAESKEKLQKIKPRTLGQASRISGVTPSDISILLVYLKS